MKRFFAICFIVLSTAFAFGQHGAIKGKVTDLGMNGEPVLFANIEVKGVAQTAETNFHGNFEIENLKPGKYKLVVSYLGYETIELYAEVAENQITEINGALNPLSFSMDDLGAAVGFAEKGVSNETKTAELPKK